MAHLLFTKGIHQGQKVELAQDRIVMGRNANCTIVLNDPAVSREHAVIRKIQENLYIEDLQSRNCTYVNNKKVETRTQLKDGDKIKICDNLLEYHEPGSNVLPPLPATISKGVAAEELEKDSSKIEATITKSQREVLEAQPVEKLSMLVQIGQELAQAFQIEVLLPKIVDHLFNVFRQADRAFIILSEDGALIPKVIRMRRPGEEDTTSFSRQIVRKCLENSESILSEDATSDERFNMSQSIADYRIRSVMCAPLVSRSTGKSFGVVQLDTQDRFKKFKAEDLPLLLAVAGQAAGAIENAQLHETLVARAGLERDLKFAHQVQKSFLPKKNPQVPGYEFFAHYESAQEVGGDYYDFIPLSDKRLGVMLGDVAGKGVPAALLMAKVSSDARFCILTEKSLPDAIARLNDQMQEAGLLDRFVTLGACLLDTATHTVTCVNAGHIPPLVYRKSKQHFEEGVSNDQSGYPLGVVEGLSYEANTFTLEPGDCVMLFSDGVTDAKNREDHEFQMAGVQHALKGGPMSPKPMGERLLAAVKLHALGCKQYDDITVVCFGRA